MAAGDVPNCLCYDDRLIINDIVTHLIQSVCLNDTTIGDEELPFTIDRFRHSTHVHDPTDLQTNAIVKDSLFRRPQRPPHDNSESEEELFRSILSDVHARRQWQLRVANNLDSSDEDDENANGDSGTKRNFSVVASIASSHRSTTNQSRHTGDIGGPKWDRRDMNVNDLPPIERLCITVDEKVELKRLGAVKSIVETLVVIHSDTASTSIQTAANPSALDENSVLFTCERRSLGAVFEIFGPVARPLYSVRMQSEQHIEDIKLRVGDAVFYAPKEMKFTNHVFTTQLLRERHHDDNDVISEDSAIEFSDDDAERSYRESKNAAKQDWQQQNNPESGAQGTARGGGAARKRLHRKSNRRQNQQQHANGASSWNNQFGSNQNRQQQYGLPPYAGVWFPPNLGATPFTQQPLTDAARDTVNDAQTTTTMTGTIPSTAQPPPPWAYPQAWPGTAPPRMGMVPPWAYPPWHQWTEPPPPPPPQVASARGGGGHHGRRGRGGSDRGRTVVTQSSNVGYQ